MWVVGWCVEGGIVMFILGWYVGIGYWIMVD